MKKNGVYSKHKNAVKLRYIKASDVSGLKLCLKLFFRLCFLCLLYGSDRLKIALDNSRCIAYNEVTKSGTTDRRLRPHNKFTEINRYFWTRGGYFFLYARTATNIVTSPIITSSNENKFSYVTYCIRSPP